MCRVFLQSFADAHLPLTELVPCDARNQEEIGTLLPRSGFVMLCGGHVPTQNHFFAQLGLPGLFHNYHGIVLGVSAGSMNAARLVYAAPEEAGEAADPGYCRWKFTADAPDKPLNSEAARWRKAMQDGMRLTPLSRYDGQPIYKIVYIAEHLRDLDEAKRLYQDQFVFCESNLDTMDDGMVNGELINRKFDKGTGIRAICRHLGHPQEDTIGFGDSDNDLQMTQAAGISVCMGNGSERLKQLCDRIAPTVYEDGLAREFAALGLTE